MEYEMITQPHNLNITLYKHQLINIHTMEKMERKQPKIINKFKNITFNFGFNSDKTGYGKTISMVALCLRDKMEWDVTKEYVVKRYKSLCLGNLIKEEIISYNKLDCNLVICGANVIRQWKVEFSHAPSLNVGIITKAKDFELVNPYDFDVILIVPTFYNLLVEKYSGKAWKRLIYDEVSNIVVKNMKEVVAGFYWFVTATPNEICYNYSRLRENFIKSFFFDYISVTYSAQFISGDLLHTIVKSTDELLQESYNMPLPIHLYHKCSDIIKSFVRDIGISNEIIEYIEAGDIDSVIKVLGGKKTDNVYELFLSNKEKQVEKYKQYIERLDDDMFEPEESKIAKNMRYETKILKLTEEIKILRDRLTNMIKTGECPICYDKFRNTVIEPCCQNMFCSECLFMSLRSNNCCPMCRSDVDIKGLIYINDGNSFINKVDERVEESVKLLTKNAMVEKIIKETDGGKFLLYSSNYATFDNIIKFLNDKDISYSELKGDNIRRENIIKKFKDGHTKILFLNSKFNGSGINLQEATDIILYHQMPEDTEVQIIGRGNRIGRVERLRVHHLYSANE